MSVYYRLTAPSCPELLPEELGDALLLDGVRYPWQEISIPMFTDSRAWGYDVTAPAGSFTRTACDGNFRRQEKEWVFTLSVGDRLEIIQITDDGGLDCRRWMGTDAAGE